MKYHLIAAAWITCLSSILPAQELLIRYTFDEESGPALDSGAEPQANGLLGSTAARVADTPGTVPGFALDLREAGTDSLVNAGDVSKVDTLESFTLTTWLKLEGLNADQGGSGNVRLIAKQSDGAFDGISWNLNAPNQGQRGPDNFRTGLFIGGDFAFDFAYSEEDVFADEWAFLAVTYDSTEIDENTIFYFGNETIETYMLGDEIPETINAGAVKSTAGRADFGVGFTDGAPDVDFAADGFQDDVRVYSGALSLEQLEAVRLENLTSMSDCDPNTGGDLDGNGTVEFADFLVLSGNFGKMVDSHEQGDIDCNGTVEFADFLVLSGNFGKSVGETESVPEPAGSLLVILSCLSGLVVRRRR